MSSYTPEGILGKGADGFTPAEAAAPSYYDFPGGVQVCDISIHLTGCGAQAVQYIARATRLDGRVKGDRVGDLRKARDFIDFEIARLEA